MTILDECIWSLYYSKPLENLYTSTVVIYNTLI